MVAVRALSNRASQYVTGILKKVARPCTTTDAATEDGEDV